MKKKLINILKSMYIKRNNLRFLSILCICILLLTMIFASLLSIRTQDKDPQTSISENDSSKATPTDKPIIIPSTEITPKIATANELKASESPLDSDLIIMNLKSITFDFKEKTDIPTSLDKIKLEDITAELESLEL